MAKMSSGGKGKGVSVIMAAKKQQKPVKKSNGINANNTIKADIAEGAMMGSMMGGMMGSKPKKNKGKKPII